MALSKSFKLAELIRHIEYDSSDDVIKTSKRTEDKNKKRKVPFSCSYLNLLAREGKSKDGRTDVAD